MKMGKKLLAVVLAGVLALTVLTGCGGGGSTSKSLAEALSEKTGLTVTTDDTINAKAVYQAKKDALDEYLEKNPNGSKDDKAARQAMDKAVRDAVLGAAVTDNKTSVLYIETKGQSVKRQAEDICNNILVAQEGGFKLKDGKLDTEALKNADIKLYSYMTKDAKFVVITCKGQA